MIQKFSIRVRLTVLFILIFGVTLLTFSGLLYQAFVRETQTEFDSAIFNHAVDISQSIEVGLFGEVQLNRELLLNTYKIYPYQIDRALIQIYSLDGRTILKSKGLGKNNLPNFKEDLNTTLTQGAMFRTVKHAELIGTASEKPTNYRMLSYLISDSKLGPVRMILKLAAPTTVLEQERKGLFMFIVISIPLTLILAGFGGIFVSNRALNPIAQIIKTAKKLNGASLGDRIPLPKTKDELFELTTTLNDLLERLQNAFSSQERFVANASHELKTPLAILRGEFELLAKDPSLSSEYKSRVKSFSIELSKLTAIVEQLLLLARVESGGACLSKQTIRIDESVMDVMSRLSGLANEKNIPLSFNISNSAPDLKLELDADPDLVNSLVYNLVENAIKYSPESKPVHVVLDTSLNGLKLNIHNEGEGISKNDLPNVFDRFFQIQTNENNFTNSNHSEKGVGLGLAIAKKICDVHGFRIEASSTPQQNTCFEVHFS